MPKSGSRKKGHKRNQQHEKKTQPPPPAKKPTSVGADDAAVVDDAPPAPRSSIGVAVTTTAANNDASMKCAAETNPQKNVELSAVGDDESVAVAASPAGISESASTAPATATDAEQEQKPDVGEKNATEGPKVGGGVVDDATMRPVVVEKTPDATAEESLADRTATNTGDSSLTSSGKKKKPNNKKKRLAEKALAESQALKEEEKGPTTKDVPADNSMQGTETVVPTPVVETNISSKVDDTPLASSASHQTEEPAEKIETASCASNDAKKSTDSEKPVEPSSSDSSKGTPSKSPVVEKPLESVATKPDKSASPTVEKPEELIKPVRQTSPTKAQEVAVKSTSEKPAESLKTVRRTPTPTAKVPEVPVTSTIDETVPTSASKVDANTTIDKTVGTSTQCAEPKTAAIERQPTQSIKPACPTVQPAVEQRPSVAPPSVAVPTVPEVVPRFFAKQAHHQLQQYQLQQQLLQQQLLQQQQQRPAAAVYRSLPVPGANIRMHKPFKVEKDFIFTRIPKYAPRRELAALEAVDYKFDDSLNRREAQLLRLILSFNDFTGPCEYVQQMQLIIEIEDAFAQRDQWKHIKRQMAVVKKFRDNPDTVPHEWVDISQDQLPCFVDVGDRVLLTSGVGRRFGNSIREHQRNQLLNNVYATIVRKVDGWLCIAPNSPLAESSEFTMQYVLNRMNYQLERYALERLHELRLAPLLFPMMDLTLSTVRADSIRPLVLVDAQLDDVQALAVRSIVAGVHHPRPFVLSGVAGSGKTRVIVESILQLHRNYGQSRILITSAANNILDELLLTLHESGRIPETDFLRLNSATAGHTDAGENPLHNLIDPTNDRRAQNLSRLSTCVSKINTPSMADEVMQARLVLCTLSVCGRIAMSNKLKLDNFTHIFVVKAEAANESTCLVPLCCLSGQPDRIVAHVVLCGDTAQLGPIVKSPVAKRMHYGRSLLERLESCPLYSRWDGVLSVRLRRNYRSLPELLELPNMLSYNGQMEAGVHYTQRMKAELSTTFAGYPILFHSVENGQPVREPRSCSWSNISEANIVIAYVYYYMDLGVSVDDIGIITPYKQQMKTIQKGIVDFSDTPHRNRLRIGSVEEFQGREKKIIIVSTVRNNKLGFINSRKRINVMLTRATSMLIIVGNGEFLSSDMSVENDWKDVIRHCRKQPGAFISTK